MRRQGISRHAVSLTEQALTKDFGPRINGVEDAKFYAPHQPGPNLDFHQGFATSASTVSRHFIVSSSVGAQLG